MHDLIPMPASGILTAIEAEAVLELGRGKTKTGRFWRYAVDDQLWTGSSHPAAACVYSGDRRGEHAIRGDASKSLWANRLPAVRGSFLL